MRNLFITFTIIICLGIASIIWGRVYLADIAGFISSIGLMLVYFKDRPEEESTAEKLRRRNWYLVFFIGLFFAIVFGSMWNTKMS